MGEAVVSTLTDQPVAPLNDAAVSEHGGQGEQVVGGYAVLHAARPAGVAGEITANGRSRLARRVGRIAEANRLGSPLYLGGDGPRANVGDHLRAVYGDGFKPIEADQERPGTWRRAACQATARPTGHHRHTVGCRHPHEGRDFLSCGGQRHGEGAPQRFGDRGVGFVATEFFRARQQEAGADHGAQGGKDDGGVHGAVRRWQRHSDQRRKFSQAKLG